MIWIHVMPALISHTMYIDCDPNIFCYYCVLTLLYVFVWIVFGIEGEIYNNRHLGLTNWEWNRNEQEFNWASKSSFVSNRDSKLQENFRHKWYTICILDALYEIVKSAQTYKYLNQISLFIIQKQSFSSELFRITNCFKCKGQKPDDSD